MRENRPYGSEGGVAKAIPTPIRFCARRPHTRSWVGARKRAAKSSKETGPWNKLTGPRGGTLASNFGPGFKVGDAGREGQRLTHY
jgi:hypothetical protein